MGIAGYSYPESHINVSVQRILLVTPNSELTFIGTGVRLMFNSY